MFWLRTKLFRYIFSVTLFRSDTLGWAFALIKYFTAAKKEQKSWHFWRIAKRTHENEHFIILIYSHESDKRLHCVRMTFDSLKTAISTNFFSVISFQTTVSHCIFRWINFTHVIYALKFNAIHNEFWLTNSKAFSKIRVNHVERLVKQEQNKKAFESAMQKYFNKFSFAPRFIGIKFQSFQRVFL